MLNENEELWEKMLPHEVEILISEGIDQMDAQEIKRASPKSRDRTQAVTFKAARGTAVQLYNFRDKKSRIVFGPELIMLGPYEDISVLSLSGGFPIQEGFVRSLSLELGPSQIRDQIIVETVDHAKLLLDLSYNWEFRF